MNKHGSLNRTYRLVRNEVLGTWVPAAETGPCRGKRSGRSAALVAPLLGALALGAGSAVHAGGAPAGLPPPAATQLPTGGKVVAGAATISSGNPGQAVLNVSQSSQRGIIDWTTFNVGSAAQVNFVQPNSGAVTLNEVLSSNPSQIFGRITATGQVFLSNPNGVYFAKGATVDVGGLVATTDAVDNSAFMQGRVSLTRNGSTGSVVNDGSLHATLGGYIALLAPEVRNGGIVVARMGTVALASGESVTLTFDDNHLAGISVQPSAIAAVVENKGAVLAPGGLIILSAKALDHLQGGVINNSGTVEATGLATKGGRIVLEASDSVTNSGTISADAGADGSPAGNVAITAPAISNSGTISAATTTTTTAVAAGVAGLPPTSGGDISLQGATVTQAASGVLDVSGASGGSVTVQATADATLAGRVSAAAEPPAAGEPPAAPAAAPGRGGNVTITAADNVTLQDALLDVSGDTAGGTIRVVGGAPAPSAPPGDPPTLALLGETELDASSRRGRGGSVTLTADRVGLFDGSRIDASAAAGGGQVYVGGGFHGQDPSIANARQVVIGSNASIDASAIQSGDGGRVAVWSDGTTQMAGQISARGGPSAGDGGFVEVSGKQGDGLSGTVDAGAAHGAAGTLLIDPNNITIIDSGSTDLTGTDSFGDPATDYSIASGAITAVTNTGTSVVLDAANNITVSSSITTSAGGNGGGITFDAGGSIAVNAAITSDNGALSFILNDKSSPGGATGAAETFTNTGLIDAGTGAVTITMGTRTTSGGISTGKITAGALTINQNATDGDATTGAIDLGELNITGALDITSAIGRNVTNTVGNVVDRGTTTINVGTGDVTIDNADTDFSKIGITAHNVTLADVNSVLFEASTVSGTLTETTTGAISSEGALQVTGLASFTANSGGFGSADPYIDLSNSGNHFAGGLSLSVPSVNADGYQGYANVVDSGSVEIVSANTYNYFSVISTGGGVSLDSVTAGGKVTVAAASGAVTLKSVTGTDAMNAEPDDTTAVVVDSSASMTIAGTVTATAGDISLSSSGNVTGAGSKIAAPAGNLTVTTSNGGAVTLGATTVGETITVTAPGGPVVLEGTDGPGGYIGVSAGEDLEVTASSSIVVGGSVASTGGNVSLKSSGLVENSGTISAHDDITISTTGGAVELGSVAPGVNLSVTATGAISSDATITVPGQTTLDAGSSDITLHLASPAGGGPNYVQVVSGNNVTLTDDGAITFGVRQETGYPYSFPDAPSAIHGNLSVTAGGDIGQANASGSAAGNEAITVDGATTFTTTGGSAITLDLGPATASAASGQANDFGGSITLQAADGSAGFGNVYLRNTDAGAGEIEGLTSSGTLQNVSLTYDNAPALTLPAMTLAGSLQVDAPKINSASDAGNTLSQSGAIVVAGTTVLQAGTSGDISLTNQGNDFGQLDIGSARNVSIVDQNAIVLSSASVGLGVTGNLEISTGGDITSVGTLQGSVAGTTTLDPGGHDINLGSQLVTWTGAVDIPAAGNVSLAAEYGLQLGNVSTTGTLSLSSYEGGTLTQSSGTSVLSGSTTTFSSFRSGITLTNAENVLGPLAITGFGNVSITEDDAITQASAWNLNNSGASPNLSLTLTTTNDQAITLDKTGNSFGALTLVQNVGSATGAGAVYVSETGDAYSGMTQGGAWNVQGRTTLIAGSSGISLTNPNNVLGPLSVSGGDATIYAKATAATDAITDVGATAPWDVTGQVTLVAYGTDGVTAGGGNVVLKNTGNILGPIFSLKATDATITENDSITDAPGIGSGWDVTGQATLAVANPGSKSILLDNTANLINALGISTTGAAGTLTSVVVTDNEKLQQSSVWSVGAAPVTLNALDHAIDLSTYDNVLGNISITTANGTPSSVSITEDDAITQGNAWSLTGVPVTLVALNGKSITLNNGSNVLGDLTITGGAVSITENGDITQGGAWTTTGTTTLDPTSGAIKLTHADNVLGDLAIGGNPSSVAITEDDDITQAAAWVHGDTPFTLDAGSHDIKLTQADNVLGDLQLTAQDVTLTESDPNGITESHAWTVPGTTTLTAGNGNPIVLDANPANDFGTVSIVSASSATITDQNGIVFGQSTIADGGTLSVTAGGAITQSGAITATNLRLAGTGYATLTDADNEVGHLAAGFTGGDLTVTDQSTLDITSLDGTTGIGIGAHQVSLTSEGGTVTGLTNVNSATTGLTVDADTALALPTMAIAGAQTYTAGGGITLGGDVKSTATGAITFDSPVTLGAKVTVQSTGSAIDFADTLDGGSLQLSVDAGSGLVEFHGAVSGLGKATDAGQALTLASGGATFDSTLGANNGLDVTGPVTFKDSVTLGTGIADSTFTGLVTLGKAGGMDLSGQGAMTFSGGIQLQDGPASIETHDAALALAGGSVSGPYGLTLDAGSGAVSGLDHLGSDLTSLAVTGSGLTIPEGGVSIAGPQSYTAAPGSSITLDGNVTSTAAGAVSFNGPVSVLANASVASDDSSIVFTSTVDGGANLTVNSGSGTTTFEGKVGSMTPLGSGTGAALVLQGSGTTTFEQSVRAGSGITAAGAVTFDGGATLGDGDTGSTFSGLVTVADADGNQISGYDGLQFNGGLALQSGATTVTSNGSEIHFGAPVTGSEDLTLDALAGGQGTVTGLEQIGPGSTLTALSVTAQTLDLPATGLAVAGPMTFSAPGGITLNGAVGDASRTGAITFESPILLATADIPVSTHNADIEFQDTVDGAEALALHSGTGTATFGDAVGGSTALNSIDTDAGGTTVFDTGGIQTTGHQTYNGAVSLAADVAVTGVDVSFNGTLDGAHSLTVNDSGTTTFAGVVGGTTPLTGITTDAPGGVALNTAAITTSGAQTYHDNVLLGVDSSLTGVGLTFGGTVRSGAGAGGGHALTADAGSGTLSFDGAIGGGTTPLASLTASGNAINVDAATTAGAQSYTAAGGITLGGNLTTSGGAVTVAGPSILDSDVVIATSGGDIAFTGASSTINGSSSGGQALTLTAGAGDVTLAATVGGNTPLAAMTVSGNDITLADVDTALDANQSYTALGDITLTRNWTVNAPLAFTADADGDGVGTFTVQSGVALTVTNHTLDIQAADLDVQDGSSIASGTGVMTLTASGGRNLALGGADAEGQMTITGNELARLVTSGGLALRTTCAGGIQVDGITADQSQNVGPVDLEAQGTGDVSFVTAASQFNGLKAGAAGGTIELDTDLSTSGKAVEFATPVTVAAQATIDSGGGNVTFDGTVAADHDLTVSTGNGALSFGGAVSGDKTLTLNLGGGSVSGLNELQNSLTGLTVNSNSAITLPAFGISGPDTFNTGPVTVTGELDATGITFNGTVDAAPAAGTTLKIDAGTGTLAFNSGVSLNAVDVTLVGDEVNFSHAVTGSGSLAIQPFTQDRDIEVGGSDSTATSLNLTAGDLQWLPAGTLQQLTIGRNTGTGSVDITGDVSLPGLALTLNGGDITQSGGSLAAASLTLHASGGIDLENGQNAFGPVAITGTPTSVKLTDTQDITQLGEAGWALGTTPVTLDAGSHDIDLTNTGNSFGTLVLTGGSAVVKESGDIDLGASSLAKDLTLTADGAILVSGALDVGGNASFTAGGTITQTAALSIDGNLDLATTVAAGDVTVDNSQATTLGSIQTGGDFTLGATGQQVSQASGTDVEVRGDLSVTGSNVVLSAAGNLVGGQTPLPGSSDVEIRQAGLITLGSGDYPTEMYSGDLTVVSERTSRAFQGDEVNGAAISLANAMNKIGGTLTVSASPETVTTGADVATGIVQQAGTHLSVTGTASFTAEASTAGSQGIVLENDGNQFNTLILDGSTVNVKNSSSTVTTIAGATATTSLTLNTMGGIAQTGAITTPALTVTAGGGVTLTDAQNDAGQISITSGGNPVSYTSSGNLQVEAIDAGNAAVTLTAAGIVTQGDTIRAGTLGVDATGSIMLTNTGNNIGSVSGLRAAGGVQLFDGGSLTVNGTVEAQSGDVVVRAAGDIILQDAAAVKADAGNVVVSTEGEGNFQNESSAAGSALVAGEGYRWLVYTDTPDLVDGPHTVKGGLTSDFRQYGATDATDAPDSVTQSGDGFIYSHAAGTVTVTAVIDGAASQVYGDSPTGVVGYKVTGDLLDSEDTIANTISGTAAYDTALTASMNAGGYTVKYTGGLTSQYTLVPDTAGAAYSVTPATLTYTADTASRAYGSASPALTGTLTGFKLDQDVSVLGGAPTWTTTAGPDSNVGYYGITGGGYVSNGNYVFAQATSNSTTLHVTPVNLTVTVLDDSKTYDGTAYSGGNGVGFDGFVNNDSESSLDGAISYGGDSQGARNAGVYTITGSGFSSGNYILHYVSGTLNIGKANLVLTSSDVTKTYDGTLSAEGAAVATQGTRLFGDDSVSGGAFAFTNANAGTGDRTVTVNGVTVNDGNGGNNYSVSYADNTTSTINPAAITVSTGNVTKTYDGLLSADGTATLVSGTLYENASNDGKVDTLSGGTFAFTDANAGAGNKTVTTSGVTVNDGNGGGNYVVTYADNTTSTISRKPLTFDATVQEKTYDGTADATLSGYRLVGLVGDQTLQAVSTAQFSDQNAGIGKAVSITGITLENGTDGGLASNYIIDPTSSATGTIDKKVLTAAPVVANKVYDGSAGAAVQSYGLTGFVGDETVSAVSTGSAAFSDSNAANGKRVTITGVELVDGGNGGLASNYTIDNTLTASANIAQAPLHIAGVVALDKVYDGTTTADLDTRSAVLSGVVGDDQVSVGALSGSFDTKDVGTDKPVTAGTAVLTGGDAGNYILVQPTGLTASITPRSLTVSATGVNKVYDGTTAAQAILSDNRVAGDSLAVSSDDQFADKNAGSGKYISVSDIELSGPDAKDYVLNDSSIYAYANILKAPLAVTAAGVNKVYDGTTTAGVTLSDTPIGSDVVDVGYQSASFSDKNVGNGKTVTVNGLVLSGADAANYTTERGVTTTADITPATLVVGAIGGSKTFDGTTTAPVTLTDSRIKGDDLTILDTGANFTDPAVGDDKLITVTGIHIAGGADSGNYVLVSDTATAYGDIESNAGTTDAGMWSRTPVVVPPSAPAVTTPPASVLDLTIHPRAGLTGGTAAAGNGVPSGTVDGSAPVAAPQSISVAVVQAGTADTAGVVSVMVPAAVIASGGFTFPLPAAVTQDGRGHGKAQVTLADGRRLPRGLRYDARTGAVRVSSALAASLPIELAVQAGGRRWQVRIDRQPGS